MSKAAERAAFRKLTVDERIDYINEALASGEQPTTRAIYASMDALGDYANDTKRFKTAGYTVTGEGGQWIKAGQKAGRTSAIHSSCKRKNNTAEKNKRPAAEQETDTLQDKCKSEEVQTQDKRTTDVVQTQEKKILLQYSTLSGRVDGIEAKITELIDTITAMTAKKAATTEAEVREIKIDDAVLNEVLQTKTFRLGKVTMERFAKFAKDHPAHKTQHLLTQAIFEFMERHKSK